MQSALGQRLGLSQVGQREVIHALDAERTPRRIQSERFAKARKAIDFASNAKFSSFGEIDSTGTSALLDFDLYRAALLD